MKQYMGKYSKKQIGFIIGMILGDGYISKYRPKRANSFLGCRHSKNQTKFIKHKMEKLQSLGFKVSKLYDTSNNYGQSFSFECREPKLFNQLRLVLYPKNNKTIKRKWLNYLDAESLAIWFMDDGSYTKRGKSAYISLHTNSFNKKEHDIIIKYFKQVWEISPTLRVVKRKDRRQSYFLTFNVEETKKLVKILEPHMINSMKYKVGFEFKELPDGKMRQSELYGDI
jgi:recombination protein RecA